MADHRAAARPERQAVDVSALLNSRLIGYSVVPGRASGSPTASALMRCAAATIPLEQERRRLERRGDVVEAEVRRRRSAAAR